MHCTAQVPHVQPWCRRRHVCRTARAPAAGSARPRPQEPALLIALHRQAPRRGSRWAVGGGAGASLFGRASADGCPQPPCFVVGTADRSSQRSGLRRRRLLCTADERAAVSLHRICAPGLLPSLSAKEAARGALSLPPKSAPFVDVWLDPHSSPMAPLPGTPKPRVRSSGRPLKRTISDSAPPYKKRKYIPGGPGGGGRYVDEDGLETPVGGTGPGGYAYTGPRGRIGRMNAERQGLPLPAPVPTPSPSYTRPRPRRERPPAGPRSSSAAAVAAAVAQNDGYKPREERGWEEFHQTLDIDLDLHIYSADQVDGMSPPDSAPSTPVNGASTAQFAIESGVSAHLEGIRVHQASQEAFTPDGLQLTPRKRGPGRPPRKNDSMLNGLGSPPRPRINPLPTMNPKEKLNLPKPSTRQVETFKAYEESEGVKVNYVDRTMASIGYQESEIFARPEKALIRVPEGSIEEDLDLTLQSEGEGTSAVAVGRVEYDMDEQDDCWLETVNLQRREEGVEPIKPAIFEVTITQIEKEWHALEKRKSQISIR